MARVTKKDIFNEFGLLYDGNNHVYHDVLGWIPLPLVDGNDKIGKGVFHYSTLPSNKSFHVVFTTSKGTFEMDIVGTCPFTCPGCYGLSGNYRRYPDTYNNLGLRTWLAYNDLDFLKRAIMAQIKALKIKFVRIHATGDFFSADYVEMWIYIVSNNPSTVFWTYTKFKPAEYAFDGFDNANIVKSVIKGKGFNYGHCDYIIDTYHYLQSMGKKVYICRCGVDKNQHCNDCKGCSVNEYVLFIEHSTDYKKEEDLFFETLKQIIESQQKPV